VAGDSDAPIRPTQPFSQTEADLLSAEIRSGREARAKLAEIDAREDRLYEQLCGYLVLGDAPLTALA
jgi:hypothetical protein